jgi:hypothetical protein
MPANLKVVMLSTSGPGTVVEDNSEAIGRTLFELAGTRGSGLAVPQAPQHGVMIGGSQTVTPRRSQTGTVPGPAGTTRARMRPADSIACSVSGPGAGTTSALALAWLLLGVLPALRGRHR